MKLLHLALLVFVSLTAYVVAWWWSLGTQALTQVDATHKYPLPVISEYKTDRDLADEGRVK